MDDHALAFEGSTVSPAERLGHLAQEAARHRVALPESFVRFLHTQDPLSRADMHCLLP